MRYCGNLLLEQLLQTLSSFLGACLIADCGQTEEAVTVLAEACTRRTNDVGMDSWTFFDYLLENANVVGTPGSGFGPSGEGYFRLTAFGNYENTVKALERIKAL